ncbi:hypothetical protein ElyMa_003366500 [Elysia marginata]|uniref:Uncharacterized protein n=1 Tax=Elysia marginata TaxID=1093978 RepID=A0AAV4JIB7_9GAST|nr:hypothetical protein ElyMa_003366500 [Elysia marginata]
MGTVRLLTCDRGRLVRIVLRIIQCVHPRVHKSDCYLRTIEELMPHRSQPDRTAAPSRCAAEIKGETSPSDGMPTVPLHWTSAVVTGE